MEIETTDDAARFLSRDNWRSKLFTIKKSELLVVSDYLELDFTLSSTNDDIRKGIIAHLVQDGVDVDFKLLEEEIDEDCEVVKLRLKLDLKKLEFEDEQKQREHELSMKQLENEQQKRDHELELARLTGSQSPISGNEDSRMLKYVPKFDESDVVEFFIAFEKVAANFNWSEDKWAFMAQTAFSGKALKAWASLSLEDSKDYAKVKEAVLRIYEMVPEAYRVKFRDSRKSSNQTFVEFAREMEKHFENWLRSSDVNYIVAREAKFAVVDTLPIPEVDVVLANDLAQGKVSCNPTVFANPQVLVPKPETVLVTTRSGKSTDFEVEHPELESLFNADSLDHVSSNKSICSEKVMNWNRDDLVRVQNEDIEIKNIKIKLKEGKGVDYEVDNEVLYKVIVPIRKREGNLLKHRVIVVPSKFRNGILRKAHDDLFAGHLGITKTFDRVRKNFYWKGLKRDVKKYCKTCHQCQISGKPNMVIPKAPLSPIPSLGEPFEHVVIDVMGPLPRSKVGSEYVLTIIDRLTRYPEAIPLKSQKARVIAKHLINYFSRFGLPKTIQSDRGTNFLSKLLLQQFKNFGIEHKPSTPYHPESQGIVERFHQTLKAMIRKMCNEKVGLWEEYLPYLLFAVRSIPNESTNFAPFNLVFAHKVRGPLDLLREVWEGNGLSEVNIADLINDGKDKLYEMWEIAKSNLLKSQSKMKSLYDLKSKERVFVPGDKVLVLSQGVRGSLQNKFLGPFEVLSKVNDLNYIIKLPDRNLQCHINMLKKYFEREKTVVLSVAEEVNSKCVTSEKEFAWPGNNSVLLPNVCRSPILSTNQINGLLKVLMKFPETVRDTPGRTTLVQHDVELENETPIRQAPYRLNPVKKEFVEKEINYLLTNNLITPSSSSWSSPIVVVAKENGQNRLCIDYRKVNKATKADSFPIPRVDDCIDKVGNSKFITKIDLLKGYYQVPLSNRAKEVSAFVTADGLYQFEVMPFGMRNAAATFQRLMAMITRGIKNCVVYIDDIIVYSNDFETHLVILEELLTALSNAGLVINLSKSVFCEATVTFLGHVVGKGEVLPKEVNVAKIKEFPVPSSKRELQRFLGMAGYYSRFVANYSDVVAPLTNLLRKHSKFVWDEKCKESFEIVKCVLTSSPVLRAPNFELPFSLAVDASDQGVGAVLLQVCEDGVSHPISYFSKKMNKHQVKYSVIEKEALALILSLLHFEAYISAQSGKVIVYTDHNPLKYIQQFNNKNRRLTRWAMFLQDYNLEVIHIPGKDNNIPDALSRM
ncbi:uncharacterized protein [Palaemon carinicauda]|uniref:uncharacterized protein n=1 Tax=Palaemon carinicauda TaxID=392227 RepID=UPI0035B61CD3